MCLPYGECLHDSAPFWGPPLSEIMTLCLGSSLQIESFRASCQVYMKLIGFLEDGLFDLTEKGQPDWMSICSLRLMVVGVAVADSDLFCPTCT